MSAYAMRPALRRWAPIVIRVALFLLALGHAGAQSQPVLDLAPSSGPAGTTVSATGAGFALSPCGVELRLDSPAGALLGSAELAGAEGSFATSFDVPPGTQPGPHEIFAQGLVLAGEFCAPSPDQAHARFVVEASPDAVDFRIYLQNRVLGPDCGVDPDFVDEIRGSGRPVTHGIVQLRHLPRVETSGPEAVRVNDVDTLAALGIRLLDYLNGIEGPGAAYLAALASDLAVDDPRFDELVRCLLPLEPQDKIERGLASAPSGPEIPLLVSLFGDVSDDEARALFARLGIVAQPFAPGLWETSAALPAVQLLAAEDAVRWIEVRIIDELFDMDEARDEHGADTLQGLDTASGVYAGLSGDGVQIGVMDSGVDDDHHDFDGRIVRFFDNGGDHGSHVAGIAAGSGFQSDKLDDANDPNGGAPFQWRGMAPEAEIAAYSSSGATAGGNAGTMGDAINNFGVDVSNHSYSSAPSGQYNALMASIDTIIRGDAAGVPARPQVWSAGNGGLTAQYGQNLGYFALTKTCKNCTIVANVTKTQVHSGGSSMGPTADGRLKPDVSAIGSSVTSVGADADADGLPATGNGYRVKGGTSMATPAVTGVVALMLEQQEAATGLDIDLFAPLPATSRAVLIQSADDLAGTDPSINPDTGAAVNYGAGPDWATGYGFVDAVEAARIVEDQGFIENGVSLLDTTDDWGLAVAAGQTRVRVTLAWDDRPGTPLANDAAAKLVNDLDLVLVEPDGVSVHRPWVLPLLTPRDCDLVTAGIQVGSCPGLDPPAQNYFGPASPGIDRRNNAEQVFVESAAGLAVGNWTARVSVLNDDGVTVRLPLGGSQPYTLVLQQPNETPVAACETSIERNADGDCCVDITVDDVDAGSFDPNGDADIASHCITAVDGAPVACLQATEICGTGNHTVTLTITDSRGASASCDAGVVVVDVTPPAIDCPDDRTLECPADTSPAANGVATAEDNCSTPSIEYDDVTVPGCGGTETVTRTWTARDDAGNSSECVQVIEVVDTTPPEVSCAVADDALWPPNHKLHDVGFTFEAADACDPDPPTFDVVVTSDEDAAAALGAGGPLHCPDAVVGDDLSVELRAERSGGGDGRVYRIEVNATDACGNVGTCSRDVSVKHSNGKKGAAVDSGQLFDATDCSAASAAARPERRERQLLPQAPPAVPEPEPQKPGTGGRKR